jgi:hypothetical protein
MQDFELEHVFICEMRATREFNYGDDTKLRGRGDVL